MIKILHITQSYGGVEVYIRQIIENISTQDFIIEVVGPENEAFQAFCEENNIPFFTVDLTRGFSPFKDLKSAISIYRIIKKRKPGLIHIHSSKAGLIGRTVAHLTKSKHIFTPHGISYLSFSGFKRSIFIAIETFASKLSYKVLACSHSEKIRYKFEMGIEKNIVDALPNAIKIDINNKHIINRNRISTNSDIIKIGTISRLTYQKDPLLFVDVANLISNKYPKINFTFSILGTGLTDHLRVQVEQQIKKYSLQNKFNLIGWGDKNKSQEYLKSLDIFILTSVFEGLPLSLLEAMSLGIPCITSKADGCNDVIQNGSNGFSCISKEEYINSIDLLLNNEDIQSQISSNAIEYIQKNHNINTFIKKLEEYYKQTVTDK